MAMGPMAYFGWTALICIPMCPFQLDSVGWVRLLARKGLFNNLVHMTSGDIGFGRYELHGWDKLRNVEK